MLSEKEAFMKHRYNFGTGKPNNQNPKEQLRISEPVYCKSKY